MIPGSVFLEDNIEVLYVSESLSKQLLKIDVAHQNEVSISLAHGDLASLSIDGRWIHDREDPIREARAHVDGLVSEETVDLAVLFGLGLGYHAEQLERRYDCRILIFDPCIDALRASLGARPLSLTRTFVTNDLSELSDLARGFLQFSDRRLVIGAIPSYVSLFPQQFEVFKVQLEAAVHNAGLMESTIINRVPTWIEHVMSNIVQTPWMPGFEDIGDRFSGKPGILVAAGPSLARNIDVLRSAHGRALVVGLNTSLPQLAQGNVIPDIVAVVEGLNLLSQFDVPFLDQLLLAPAVIAHPELFCLKARHIVPFSDSAMTDSDWLIRAFDAHRVHTGGSVACSAFSILHTLGCDPIILVGQDLAYTGGARYAPGAKFGTQKIEYDPASGTVITVERNATLEQIRAAQGLSAEDRLSGEEVLAYGGQGKVVTTKMFSMFRNWFESSAKTWASDRRLINSTEGGARIEGFEEMPLAEALSRFAAVPLPAKELIDEALSNPRPRDPQKLLAVIEEDIQKCRTYIEQTKKATQAARLARARTQEGGLANAETQLNELRLLEAELSIIPKQFKILDNYVAAEVNRLRQMRHEDKCPDSDRQAINSLVRSETLFEAVARGAEALIERMERVSDAIAQKGSVSPC
jgi:hypothetical protein